MNRTVTRMLALTAALAFAHAAGGRAVAQRAKIDFGELDRAVLAELKKTNTPGAAVAVVSGDRVIYAKGFGVSNVETGAPVTADTLFRLGSTTKMFTGAALLALEEGGKVKLDAPIGNYAAGLGPGLGRLTAHQLLSNTAGVADFSPPFVSHDDEALSRMVRSWKDDVLFTEPGRVYSYSSPGFWLAGYVIEQAGGKPYADQMDELIFKPLGMKSTTLRPLVAMTYPLSAGHDVRGQETPAVIRPAFNNVAMWPAGSIYSNVSDLSRFVIALLNGGRLDGKQALPPSLGGKLGGPHAKLPGGGSAHYGYGLLSFEQGGVRVVMHGGFSRGYGSMIEMVPAERFAVIVQTNKSGETLGETRGKAKELMLPRTPPPGVESRAGQPLSEAEAADFAGRYANGPQTWEIVARGGKLFFKLGAEETPLTKTGPYRLSFGESLENDLILIPDAAGKAEHLFTGLYSGRKVRTGRQPM